TADEDEEVDQVVSREEDLPFFGTPSPYRPTWSDEDSSDVSFWDSGRPFGSLIS
ncbi:Hypothetical predicted protein, partial [Marmota monax]